MEAQNLLQCILLGGLLGIVGQGIRTIVGISKKNKEDNEKARLAGLEPVTIYQTLDVKQLGFGLLIGFVSGVLAYLFLTPDDDNTFALAPTKANVLAIIASGYSGVDFIEGVMTRVVPNTSSATGSGSTTVSMTISSDVAEKEITTKLPQVPQR